MKAQYYRFLFLGLLDVLAFTACINEPFFETQVYKGNTSLNATIENSDNKARAAVSEEGQVTWIDTDAIGVFSTHTQNAKFVSMGSGATVAFNGNLSSGDEVAEWAYYPYDEDASLDGNTLTFHLPAEYTYTGNSDAPMLGMTSGKENELTFRHLCGLLRITLGDLPEDADRFVIVSTGEDAPAIAGTVVVEDIQAEAPVLKVESDAVQTVTYQLGMLSKESKLRHFFVPLPVNAYKKLEVSLYGKEKTEPYFTRIVSHLTIHRSEMVNMPVLNGRTGENYVLSEETKVISEDIAASVIVSSTDKSILQYKGNFSELDVPQAGEIVISKPYPGIPYGFLGKVTDVSQTEKDTWNVFTEPVPIFEAFDRLFVDERLDLKAESDGTSGSRAVDNDMDDIGSFGHYFSTGVGFYNPEDASLNVTGSLSIGMAMYVYLDFDKKEGRKKVQFVQYVDPEVSSEWNIKTPMSLGSHRPGVLNAKFHSFKTDSISLAGGLLTFFPKLSYTLSGSCIRPEDDDKIGIDSKVYINSRAIYGKDIYRVDDGKWASSSRSTVHSLYKMDAELLEGINYSGSFSVSVTVSDTLMAYNNDNMKVVLNNTSTNSLGGKMVLIDYQKDYSFGNYLGDYSYRHALAEAVTAAKLKQKYTTSGNWGIDKGLFDSCEKDTMLIGTCEKDITTSEKTLGLIPTIDPLEADVESHKQNDKWRSSATLKTKLSGEILMEDFQMCLVLTDKEGKEVEASEYFSYSEVSHTFTDLLSDTIYYAYPRVKSALYGELDKSLGGSLITEIDLVNHIIKVDTKRTNRDILTEFYKATGGNRWKDDQNWCSDMDIASWYGILGGTLIDLPNNNLVGEGELDGLTYIYGLDISENELTSLTISNCLELETIYCNANQLESLKIINCPNLREVVCDNNNLTELEALPSSLLLLLCYSNQLTALDVSDFSLLEYLDCGNNYLTTLDVSNLSLLKSLSCQNNLLTTLDVSNLTLLEDLICNYNRLSILDTRNNHSLTSLSCSNNLLTTLYVDSHLRDLSCWYNDLTVLDLGHCTGLERVTCYHNDKLTAIYLGTYLVDGEGLFYLPRVVGYDADGKPIELPNIYYR